MKSANTINEGCTGRVHEVDLNKHRTAVDFWVILTCSTKTCVGTSRRMPYVLAVANPETIWDDIGGPYARIQN